MLVQIYEVTSPEEASALAEIGVDHIGVLVGEGEFPREQPIKVAKRIFSTIAPSCRGSALLLSANLDTIEGIIATLAPSILHLGASTDLLLPEHVLRLKSKYERLFVLRSIPVMDEGSISIARSYDGIADMLLLDSHVPGDAQIGALGIIHSWALDRRIVESVHIPVIIAGGLGSDNVLQAITAVRPAGVDSKTRTDKNDGSHTKDIEKVRDFVAVAKTWRNASS